MSLQRKPLRSNLVYILYKLSQPLQAAVFVPEHASKITVDKLAVVDALFAGADHIKVRDCSRRDLRPLHLVFEGLESSATTA